MVRQEQTIFEGYSCLKLDNDLLTVWITREVGLRVIGLSLADGENLLAVVPDAVIPVDGAEDYTLRGGHRLWYAPETPHTTYLTDDEPVEIIKIPDGVEVIQNVDRPTNIQKSWKVTLNKNQAKLVIDHKLSNQGSESYRLAPWGITMLKPGGLALLPLANEDEDSFGLQPNRHLVLWPYTELTSPRLFLRDRSIMVKGTLAEGALKIGAPNPVGWLAYAREGSLFVKRSAYQPGAEYYDRGASSQIYHNPSVVELETLGPIVNLGPGDLVEHQEIWEVYQVGNWPGDILDSYQSFSDF